MVVQVSKEFILELIADSLSPIDLVERLEPYLTTEELMEMLSEVIEQHYHEAFAEELGDYYDNDF